MHFFYQIISCCYTVKVIFSLQTFAIYSIWNIEKIEKVFINILKMIQKWLHSLQVCFFYLFFQISNQAGFIVNTRWFFKVQCVILIQSQYKLIINVIKNSEGFELHLEERTFDIFD